MDCSIKPHRNGPYRSFNDPHGRTKRNTPCPDIIMRCTLRMCSEYGLLATLPFCMERTILPLHALNGL